MLLITIDTLRADRLGLYGYDRPTSPCLDGFAQGAVVFEEAQAAASWTLPSLASVHTAEHPSTHGCWNFGSVLDGSFTTLAELLLAAGYDTACVASHLFATSRHGLQQGFVHSDDSYAYPEVDPAESITSQVISDKAIRFLDQKRDSPDEAPWFLWLHYFDPHDEYMQHPGISALFESPAPREPKQVYGDAYEGEIRYTDQHVGRVLDALRDDGFTKNTVVVVVADHGEEFDDHGAFRHGHTLYHELVHVPLIVKAPRTPPRRVQDVVRQVDVLPTIVDLVGLPVPQGAGRSLVPLMFGHELEEIPALSELDLNANHFDGLRTQRYKIVRNSEKGTTALFDEEADPGEYVDVASQHPDVVQALLTEMDRQQSVARERARQFHVTPELTFTPGQQEDLEGLGYVGEDGHVVEDQQ